MEFQSNLFFNYRMEYVFSARGNLQIDDIPVGSALVSRNRPIQIFKNVSRPLGYWDNLLTAIVQSEGKHTGRLASPVDHRWAFNLQCPCLWLTLHWFKGTQAYFPHDFLGQIRVATERPVFFATHTGKDIKSSLRCPPDSGPVQSEGDCNGLTC